MRAFWKRLSVNDLVIVATPPAELHLQQLDPNFMIRTLIWENAYNRVVYRKVSQVPRSLHGPMFLARDQGEDFKKFANEQVDMFCFHLYKLSEIPYLVNGGTAFELCNIMCDPHSWSNLAAYQRTSQGIIQHALSLRPSLQEKIDSGELDTSEFADDYYPLSLFKYLARSIMEQQGSLSKVLCAGLFMLGDYCVAFALDNDAMSHVVLPEKSLLSEIRPSALRLTHLPYHQHPTIQ